MVSEKEKNVISGQLVAISMILSETYEELLQLNKDDNLKDILSNIGNIRKDLRKTLRSINHL